MRKYILIVLFLILSACAHGRGGRDSAPVGVDPTLTWDAATKDCSGELIPDTTPVRYNVHAISGPGPIPTAPSPPSVPCGVVGLATGAPLNAAPLTATTFHAIVPNGLWTFAVEAVLSDGARSGLSNSVTVTVLNRSKTVINLKVGP